MISNHPSGETGAILKASGTVIDPSAAGIPGVAIEYWISTPAKQPSRGAAVPSQVEGKIALTELDGSFCIHTLENNRLGIEGIEKKDYLPGKRNPQGYYGHPYPSIDGRQYYEFLMLPAAGTPEIRIRETMSILPAGATSFRFDLDSGEISHSGNAAFRFNLFATTSPVEFRRDSEIVIAGVPTQAAHQLLAPVDGYQERSEANSTYRESGDSFYYRRGDRFGRVVISISDPSPSGEHRVLLQNYFNESGGRNTEPVLPSDDDETLKRTSRIEYDRVRKERLRQASEAGMLDDGSMSTAELAALLGPPDREENNVIFYHLIEGFNTYEWSFSVKNGRITSDDIGNVAGE